MDQFLLGHRCPRRRIDTALQHDEQHRPIFFDPLRQGDHVRDGERAFIFLEHYVPLAPLRWARPDYAYREDVEESQGRNQTSC